MMKKYFLVQEAYHIELDNIIWHSFKKFEYMLFPCSDKIENHINDNEHPKKFKFLSEAEEVVNTLLTITHGDLVRIVKVIEESTVSCDLDEIDNKTEYKKTIETVLINKDDFKGFYDYKNKKYFRCIKSKQREN